MGTLEGKVAAITGAGRGIGRAVAIAYAEEGAAIGLAARTGHEIESVAEEILARGGRAVAVPTDVTRQTDVDAFFARVREELGEVDILVNNAGAAGPFGKFLDVDPEAWREAFDINVISMVRCIRAVLPGMMEHRYGKIILVGSGAGWKDSWPAQMPEMIVYGVTKAAVSRLSYALSQQLNSYGINVNCVSPSAITRMGQQCNQEVARLRGEPPVAPWEEVPEEERRSLLPEENIGTFVFLASPQSDHVTGQFIESNRLTAGMREGRG
jgi:3-oxoacyl-[acyl-carrier protein] reductase